MRYHAAPGCALLWGVLSMYALAVVLSPLRAGDAYAAMHRARRSEGVASTLEPNINYGEVTTTPEPIMKMLQVKPPPHSILVIETERIFLITGMCTQHCQVVIHTTVLVKLAGYGGARSNTYAPNVYTHTHQHARERRGNARAVCVQTLYRAIAVSSCNNVSNFIIPQPLSSFLLALP